MADETIKLKNKLSNLLGSLEDLESSLEPLFAQSLPESVLGLETIQQAKLQVVLPYLVYDLVFIYLKTRGLDPKTHPVIAELDRVRQYFDKIKNAEDPAKRSMTVDKAAANRFIKHAINQVKNTAPIAGPSVHVRFDDDGTPQDVRVPVKVTAKMREREEYQKKLREAGSDEDSEEDEGLQVIDNGAEVDDDAPMSLSSALPSDRKGKGKASSQADEPPQSSHSTNAKGRRPAIDPFAGYGDDTPATESSTKSTPKKTKLSPTTPLDEDAVMEDTPAPAAADAQSESPDKKTKKKKKKKALPITG